MQEYLATLPASPTSQQILYSLGLLVENPTDFAAQVLPTLLAFINNVDLRPSLLNVIEYTLKAHSSNIESFPVLAQCMEAIALMFDSHTKHAVLCLGNAYFSIYSIMYHCFAHP